MIKFILSFLLILSLNTFVISPQTKLNLVTITLVDSLTSERLCGVKLKRGNEIYYSDLNGQIKIEKRVYNNSISLSLISYKEKFDTINSTIRLNKL